MFLNCDGHWTLLGIGTGVVWRSSKVDTQIEMMTKLPLLNEHNELVTDLQFLGICACAAVGRVDGGFTRQY